jgi:hypothetical protein
MPSIKRLSSVCRSLAHHAASNLSYVHPYVRQASRTVGSDTVLIDLLLEEPCPSELSEQTQLSQALRSLRVRFVEMLASEGFSLGTLKEAKLLFEFSSQFPDDHCSNCHTRLVAQSGREYVHAVNYLGASIIARTAF